MALIIAINSSKAPVRTLTAEWSHTITDLRVGGDDSRDTHPPKDVSAAHSLAKGKIATEKEIGAAKGAAKPKTEKALPPKGGGGAGAGERAPPPALRTDKAQPTERKLTTDIPQTASDTAAKGRPTVGLPPSGTATPTPPHAPAPTPTLGAGVGQLAATSLFSPLHGMLFLIFHCIH